MISATPSITVIVPTAFFMMIKYNRNVCILFVRFVSDMEIHFDVRIVDLWICVIDLEA